MGSLSLIECARFIFGESESVEVRFFRCRADFSDPGISLVVWEMVLVLFGESWRWVRREESRESRQEGRQGRVSGGLRVGGLRKRAQGMGTKESEDQ
jgi:hypothetical protein